jgi:hypothetical protein
MIILNYMNMSVQIFLFVEKQGKQQLFFGYVLI